MKCAPSPNLQVDQQMHLIQRSATRAPAAETKATYWGRFHRRTASEKKQCDDKGMYFEYGTFAAEDLFAV